LHAFPFTKYIETEGILAECLSVSPVIMDYRLWCSVCISTFAHVHWNPVSLYAILNILRSVTSHECTLPNIEQLKVDQKHKIDYKLNVGQKLNSDEKLKWKTTYYKYTNTCGCCHSSITPSCLWCSTFM